MTCTDKVFVESYTAFPLTITSGFAVADILGLEVVLTYDDQTITKSIARATLGSAWVPAGITIDGSDNILLLIDEVDITVSATYKLTVTATDSLGNESRVNPCPDEITFYP